MDSLDSLDSLSPASFPCSPLDFVETFPKTFGLALVEHGARCGKPNCQCAQGPLHPTAYLRWRDGGRQRRRYVRRADLPAVRLAMTRRRAHHAAIRAELAASEALLRALKMLSRDLAELNIPGRDG